MRETITELLVEWSNGDQAALDRLAPLVYDELRRMARTYLRGERPDHTLQATALVHEAYLRLVDQHSVSWQNRAHFFGTASQMMRRILVNHATARAAELFGRVLAHDSGNEVMRRQLALAYLHVGEACSALAGRAGAPAGALRALGRGPRSVPAQPGLADRVARQRRPAPGRRRQARAGRAKDRRVRRGAGEAGGRLVTGRGRGIKSAPPGMEACGG